MLSSLNVGTATAGRHRYQKTRAAIFFLCASVAHAAIVTTTDPAVIAGFQAGATVINFESVAGKTATAITAYNDTDVVSGGSRVFNQIPGLQFSVGAAVTRHC
jgi:hypothetical protein